MTIIVRALATVEFTVGNWSSHKTLNVPEFNDTVCKEATQHLKHHLKSSNVAVIGHPKICLVTLNEYRELPSPVVESLPDPNRGRVEELEGQVKILNERIAYLEEENTSLEQNVSALREEKQSLLDAENDLTKRIDQLTTAYDEKSNKAAGLQKQFEDRSHAYAMLLNEREQLTKSHIPELRAKIERLEAENKRLLQPVISTKLNPIQQDQVACLLRDTPEGVMNSRWEGIMLADLSRHELACALYRTTQDLARLQAQNMELIATMRDMQEKALKQQAAQFGESTLHQLIGDNGEVVHAPDVSIEQIPTQVIDAIQDLARRITPLAGKVVFESNAGAITEHWQTDGTVEHVGFDPSAGDYPRFWSAAAYIRQDGPNDIVSVMLDGSEAKWRPGSKLNTTGRIEFTREEAESILTGTLRKPEPPRTNGPESAYPPDMPF